jgi:hypothetical protein
MLNLKARDPRLVLQALIVRPDLSYTRRLNLLIFRLRAQIRKCFIAAADGHAFCCISCGWVTLVTRAFLDGAAHFRFSSAAGIQPITLGSVVSKLKKESGIILWVRKDSHRYKFVIKSKKGEFLRLISSCGVVTGCGLTITF